MNQEPRRARAGRFAVDKGPRDRKSEAGLGMIGLITTLAVLAILAVIAVKSLDGLPKIGATGGLTSASATGNREVTPTGPGGLVSETADLVATQNLMLAEDVADEAASVAGGYGYIDPTSLSAVGRGYEYTGGPSTRATQISVNGAGGAEGGVTLAVHSASDICWFLWTSGSVTRYGMEIGGSSCRAPSLPTAPAIGGDGDGTVRWQADHFPVV